MNLKTSLLALAAVVALGTTALTSTSAEAHGKGFHGGGKGFHGGHFHKGHGHGHGHFHKHHHHGHGHFHRHHRHVHWHGHWRHRHIYYPRPVVYAARPVVYSAAPTVNRCTCLTKEYTPEGAVLFKDICTNEAAINPPPAPVQTGYAPQPMTAPQAQ